MIQYGLDIPTQVKGFFTLEKELIGRSLNEIENRLGYEKGRLKQGADFYILTPPNHPTDFERMGTSIFPGHKFENSNLQKAINADGKKKEDLSLFRRKRLIKVMPLQIHLEAMRKHLSEDQYLLIKDMDTKGRSQEDFIKEVQMMYRNNQTLVEQIRINFAKVNSIYKAKQSVNDYMYPSAVGESVPQWKLNRTVPARCVCRLTDYMKDRYQFFF